VLLESVWGYDFIGDGKLVDEVTDHLDDARNRHASPHSSRLTC
jgi:hypothetical protein